MRELYQEIKQTQGLEDEDISEAMRWVEGAILRADTPLQVARRAAGEHQMAQSETRELSTFDLMTEMARECQKRKSVTGSPFLDDAALFLLLESVGLASLSRLVPPKHPSQKSPTELLV